MMVSPGEAMDDNDGGEERARSAEAELLTPGLLHEARHPLMAIKAGLHLVAGTLGEQVTGLDDWEMINAQVHRLEELLDTWQALVDRDGTKPIPFPVAPTVRRASELLRFRLKRLGDRYALAMEAPGAVALGTPKALLHAVTNLVANAVDAVEPEGGRVELRLLSTGGAVQVRVADDGVGVAPEARPRVFEPRFTTKPGGTGLGLAIARRVMEASGGAVWLVPDDDPLRRPWARTEFAVRFAP
jgi:signal transduction histidine kinase